MQDVVESLINNHFIANFLENLPVIFFNQLKFDGVTAKSLVPLFLLGSTECIYTGWCMEKYNFTN